MKQAELANKIGISQSMLHYILNGKRGIGKKTAEKLSKFSKRSAGYWVMADFSEVLEELDRIGRGGNGKRKLV